MDKLYTILLLSIVAILCSTPCLTAQTTVPEWRPHTALPTALTGHRAVLLHNGDILVAGGLDGSSQTSNGSFVYSATSGAFTPTLNTLAESRAYHALVVVPTASASRVFAIGGYTGTAGNYRSSASVEVLDFDAAANNWRWRTIGRLSVARGGCAAAWDGANFVVVSGGRVQTGGVLHSGARSDATDRIHIQTLQVEAIAGLRTARAEHGLMRALDALNRLQLVVAGGEETRPTTSTELLPAGVNTWDPLANPPVVYRSSAAAVGDIAGIARVFGGLSDTGLPLNTCEWYDVKSGWRAAPRMQTARARASVSLVAGPADTARVYMIVGGQGTSGVLRETETFELPGSSIPAGQWIPFPPLNRRGAERCLTVAGSNLPLVTGGDDGAAMAHTEIFQPLRANDIVFGSEEVGRHSDSLAVVIRNEWLLPVHVHTFRFGRGAEFTLSGDISARAIPPGGERTVYVRFRPQAAGERTDILLFNVGPLVDTVQLRGTGVESEIAVVTGSVKFDSVFVRTTERKCFTAVRNRGTDTTVIDSVVVAPSDVFRVVSPVGRVAVAPGDSLVVCVDFTPVERGSSIASVTVHIAARTFPVGLAGTGIRRYAVASSMAECDTLSIAPGDSTMRVVTLFNPSDRTVEITGTSIAASANGLFDLADPTVLPLAIAPGQTVALDIVFRPQREATERAVIDFLSNGDTATRSTLCFVLRSRFLSPSVGALDLGTLCVGDTATASFLLENPGQFESVVVDGVVTAVGANFSAVSVSDTVLLPREYMVVQVRVVPTVSGELTDTVLATGSFGALSVPVRVRAVPALSFAPEPVSVAPAPGSRIVLPIAVFGDAAPQMQRASLLIAYNKTLLHPRRLVSMQSVPALDEAQSTFALVRPGTAHVSLVWQAPVATGLAFGLECDVLRGDNDHSNLAISGSSDNSFCVVPTKRTIPIDNPCGGQSGFIRTDAASFVRALPNPAIETVQILVHPARSGRLSVEVVNALGESVVVRDLGEYSEGSVHADVDVSRLPAGVYFIRAIVDAEIIDVQPVMLMR